MKILNGIRTTLILVFCLNAESFAQVPNLADVSNIGAKPMVSASENKQNFYTFRHDLRKCVSPLCGGIFVKAVNRRFTLCADGELRNECYVAGIINRKHINIAFAALLKGRIVPNIYSTFGNLGAFELTSAFIPATTKLGQGLFVGLKNNGLMCITTPCFSFDERILNVNILRKTSGINLKKVDASTKLINQAMTIIANGGFLIASGYNKQTQDFAGPGLTFVANQFYLPIQSQSP